MNVTPITTDHDRDLKDLREAVGSRGFGLIQHRYQQILERYRLQLERDHEPVETAKLRGSIDTLRALLNVPAILEAELLEKAAK